MPPVFGSFLMRHIPQVATEYCNCEVGLDIFWDLCWEKLEPNAECSSVLPLTSHRQGGHSPLRVWCCNLPFKCCTYFIMKHTQTRCILQQCHSDSWKSRYSHQGNTSASKKYKYIHILLGKPHPLYFWNIQYIFKGQKEDRTIATFDRDLCDLILGS